MPARSRLPNRLLQALPATQFEALRPHLEPVELAKQAVLIEAGSPIRQVYLPHSGIVSMMIRLSDGQTVGVAMVGSDSIVGGWAGLHGGTLPTDAVVIAPGVLSLARSLSGL